MIEDKAVRVRQFHDSTLAALADLVRAAGLADPRELRRTHILRRVSSTEVKSFAELYPSLENRGLLAGMPDARYAEQWALADAGGFAPFLEVPAGGLNELMCRAQSCQSDYVLEQHALSRPQRPLRRLLFFSRPPRRGATYGRRVSPWRLRCAE